VRLFVGVGLNDEVRAACAEAARNLEDRLRGVRGASIRWIPDENLHVTLAFLGHVDESRAGSIVSVLGAGWDAGEFPFTLAGAGAFPSSGPPRTLWVSVGAGADRLEELYRVVSGRLSSVGIEPERRPYHPHITIGRVKDASRTAARKVRAVLEGVRVRKASGRVRSVTLFESRLSSAGARYEPLLRVPLKIC
jgi:2'-5' RNA ligase